MVVSNGLPKYQSFLSSMSGIKGTHIVGARKEDRNGKRVGHAI
jgi:hypothetical protein